MRLLWAVKKAGSARSLLLHINDGDDGGWGNGQRGNHDGGNLPLVLPIPVWRVQCRVLAILRGYRLSRFEGFRL